MYARVEVGDKIWLKDCSYLKYVTLNGTSKTAMEECMTRVEIGDNSWLKGDAVLAWYQRANPASWMGPARQQRTSANLGPSWEKRPG